MADHPFSQDDLAEMMYALPEGWEYAPFGESKIVDQSRWMTYHESVITDGNDNYYRLTWRTGSTEYQDNDDCVEVWRVFPHTVSIIEYKDTP